MNVKDRFRSCRDKNHCAIADNALRRAQLARYDAAAATDWATTPRLDHDPAIHRKIP
jgi:hypothetical protein